MGPPQARDAAVGRGGPAACMTVAPQGHGKNTKPGPTRRMPSDAQWTEVASRAGDAVSYAFQRSRSPENGDQSRRKAPCFPSPVQKMRCFPAQSRISGKKQRSRRRFVSGILWFFPSLHGFVENVLCFFCLWVRHLRSRNPHPLLLFAERFG